MDFSVQFAFSALLSLVPCRFVIFAATMRPPGPLATALRLKRRPLQREGQPKTLTQHRRAGHPAKERSPKGPIKIGAYQGRRNPGEPRAEDEMGSSARRRIVIMTCRICCPRHLVSCLELVNF